MAGKGYINLYRDICDTWLYDDKPFSRSAAFVDLLLLASHQDRDVMFNGELVKVHAGELITSDRVLMARWGWGKDKTRKFTRQLQETGWIKIESLFKVGTRISITNYGGNPFQGQTTPKPPNGPKSDHPPAPKSDHLSDHPQPSIYTESRETSDHLSDHKPDNTPDNIPDNTPVTINKKEEHFFTNNWKKEEPAVKYYGLYDNVPLTTEQYMKLSERFPSLYQGRIEYMSSCIHDGKTYENIFDTLRRWCTAFEAKNSGGKDQPKPKAPFMTRPSTDLDALEMAALWDGIEEV